MQCNQQKIRSAKEMYAAKLCRFTFEQKEKQLVSRDETNILHRKRIAVVAALIQALPEILADVLVIQTDSRNTEEILDIAIRDTLQKAIDSILGNETLGFIQEQGDS